MPPATFSPFAVTKSMPRSSRSSGRSCSTASTAGLADHVADHQDADGARRPRRVAVRRVAGPRATDGAVGRWSFVWSGHARMIRGSRSARPTGVGLSGVADLAPAAIRRWARLSFPSARWESGNDARLVRDPRVDRAGWLSVGDLSVPGRSVAYPVRRAHPLLGDARADPHPATRPERAHPGRRPARRRRRSGSRSVPACGTRPAARRSATSLSTSRT